MNRKKVLSLLTAGMMLGAMMVPASAAEITIQGGAQGAEYQAYRLLDLTTSLKTDHGDQGAEHVHGHDCYNYAYTVNPTYRAVLRTALGLEDAATDDDIIGGIQAMESNGDEIRIFADAVFEAVKTSPADETATGDSFANVDQGYYLITEHAAGAAPDAISLVMLDTAGQDDVTVQTKEGIPTLEKKIKVGEELLDADAVAAGDTVVYQLKATMPDKIDAYETYKMIFHDTVDAGLTVKPETVKVTVDGAEYANFEVAETPAEGESLNVIIADLKNGATVTKDTIVLVEYECTVDDVAGGLVLGNGGNSNVASLEFSNNPYNTAEGTSETPDDTVEVYSFALHVNKVDANGALAGAGFSLYRKEAGHAGADADGWYLINKIEAGETTEFIFEGLDEGDYKLVEDTAPDGYAKHDDVLFTIVPTFDGTALSELAASGVDGFEGELAVVANDGTFTGSVLNVPGFRLPITGGAGTYAIYGGGAALLAIGGFAAAMKKRKESTETAE